MRHYIRKYLWHAVFWISFIAYEVTSVKVITGAYASNLNYLAHYPINIAFVYTLSGYALPKTVGKHKRNILMLLILLSLTTILFFLVSNIADRMLEKINHKIFFTSAGITKIFIGRTIYRWIYFSGFAVTLFLYQNRIAILEHSNELEKEAAETNRQQSLMATELTSAKNAYLRAQINPHFMLSTLSYIHDSTRLSEPDAAQAVLYLSKLLRYALASERGPEKIPIQVEIEQVENLLNLTKIRKTHTYINFNYDGNVPKTEVIPFVLLSLAENMLKHGNLNVAIYPGEISISVTDHELIIQTSNLISSGINDTGLHTGLSSIRERLLQTYGNRGSISYIRDENNCFRTKVSLPINKNPEA